MPEQPKPQKLIALVDTLQPIFHREYDAPDIKITIARLGVDGKPRNYSQDSQDPKGCPGGCYARLYCSGMTAPSPHIYFCHYGPDIVYGNSEDYERAARALKAIQPRLDRMWNVRGRPADAADELGRWLEACGVTEVYCRPEDNHHTWLNEGHWQTWNIGRCLFAVRECFPKVETPEPVAA